jgi:maltooligosyltrehalose trehalohydrolase
MHTFGVWAPHARSAAVLVDSRRHAMHRNGDRGWWSVDVDTAYPGDDYGFLLDEDSTPLPDPRSLWQPNGVHGLSRLLDQNSYAWQDSKWTAPPWQNAVLYELHVGTFTPEGTFKTASEKLAYLRDLGVTHVELMPVNAFPGRWGWGYDGVSLSAPHATYGSPDDLKHFVDACHAKGLAVLLDVVYNHFGPDGNYTGRFGNYITANHHTPWGGAINFEESGSTEVRRFFCDNALIWLRDYHFDGLRLDAVHSYIDRSAKHFLEQLSEEVEALSIETGRTYTLIAESDLNDPRIITSRAEGGYGINAQWSDDFHHSLFALLTGERPSYYADFGSLAQLAKSLTSAFVYDGIYSKYRKRDHGRPLNGQSAEQFLGYIQNHDQVGNRALGDRIHAIAGRKKAKLAAALVLTAPFIPMIFQGEEFAADTPFLYFADHEDPQLRQAVTEGRRREHASDSDWTSIPDPEAEQTFLSSKLDWNELQQEKHAEMLHWYRSLIQLRRDHEDLRDGRLDQVYVHFDSAAQWLWMQRGNMHMLFNFGESSVAVEADALEIVLASDAAIRFSDGMAYLPPLSFAAAHARKS